MVGETTTREPSTARFFGSHLIGKWYFSSINLIIFSRSHFFMSCACLYTRNHFLTCNLSCLQELTGWQITGMQAQ